MKILQLEQKKFGKFYLAASLCILVLFFALTIKLLDKNLIKLLDSDMSSELVLSQILNSEGNILTKNWYYSTELRVVNTQLIFAPLFSFFSSWHQIRIVGTSLLLLLLLLSFLYMCKKLELKDKYILSLLVIGSTSVPQLLFIVAGTYYIPHVLITFLTLGLYANIFKNKRTSLTIIALILLSFIAGLGGLRQILVLFLPLLVTSIVYMLVTQFDRIKVEKISLHHLSTKVFVVSLVNISFATIGFLINSKILQNHFKFFRYEAMNFSSFSFSRLEQVINGWFNVYGYNSNGEIISKSPLVNNVLSLSIIFILLFSCYFIFKNRKSYSVQHKFVTLFYIIAVIIISVFFVFTDILYVDRYLLPVSIVYIPVIGIFLSNLKTPIYKGFLILVIIAQVLFCTRFNFNYAINNPLMPGCDELAEIANILKERNSYEGYASFWNANILTELSDGTIEVWDYGDTHNGLHLNNLYEWLQKTEHMSDTPTSNNIFVVLNADQNANTYFSDLSGVEIIYMSNTKIVYLFKNYDDLNMRLNKEAH